MVHGTNVQCKQMLHYENGIAKSVVAIAGHIKTWRDSDEKKGQIRLMG